MRRQAALLSLLLAACSDTDAPEALTLGEGAGRVEVAVDGTIRLVRDGALRLSFAPNAVELGLVDEISEAHSYDPYWLEVEDQLFGVEPPPGLRWRTPVSATAREDGAAVVVDVAYEGSTRAQVRLQSTADDRFSMMVVPDSGAPVAFVRVRATVDPEEAFYGLGGAPDHVSHRGFVRPMQMEPDLSIESANNELHVPVPLLIGTRGWGLFVASDRLGVFDVATEDPSLVEITYGTADASAEGLALHLFAPEHPMDALAHYYAITGAPLLPARWVYGPLIWRNENDDQAQVLDDIRKIRDLDLATSGMWIDRPYATAVNTFDFHAEQFPDPEGMLQAAHDAGLRVGLWHTPYLEEATGALREEADERGFFPPQVGLRLNRWSDPIDFTNPEAYAWWQALIRRYTDMGIEGFKLDYAEDIIPGLNGARTAWRFADGSTDRTMHRGYTLLYHQVYAETLPEAGGMLLCRAGRWGDQVNVSVIWPGDLDADLSKFGERRTNRSGDEYTAVGGLPTSVNMDLNLGASGFPFYGADTGGYRHSPPDEETFLRWVEQTALSSVMQVGDSSSQTPWEYTEENGRDDETLATYRRYARLHMRLFPYAWSYATRMAETGHPITRPLGLAHPEMGVHPNDTYLFGDDLLVAPVLERGQRRRQVNLPEGAWLDWWNGRQHNSTGATVIEVEAPVDHLPLFVRAGALVPMLRPDIDTLAPTTSSTVVSFANDPGLLWVRASRSGEGAPQSFELFDGTRVSQQEAGTGFELGYVPGDEFARGVVFDVYGGAMSVTVDGADVTRVDDPAAFEAAEIAWMSGPDDGHAWVKVARPSQVVVRIAP